MYFFTFSWDEEALQHTKKNKNLFNKDIMSSEFLAQLLALGDGHYVL